MGIKASDREEPYDLPDNVVAVLGAMGLDPREADYESLPDKPDNPDMVDANIRGQGDEYINHEGLMDMAHRDGLCLVFTDPVQVPPPQMRKDRGEPIIFRAVVATRRGVFSAYGDAIERDTMVDAVIRMAETRALNRALRAAINVGGATAEEMPNADIQVE